MDPLVSIRVVTYNHARYLARCLEGILMQKTSFPFEVVVGEDCSTDGTREIAIDYARRHPETIRLLLSETNLGGVQNTLRVRAACRGAYHAFCEGDDYWIDPLKLQKQVDCLEAHPEYTLCFHDAFVVWEEQACRPKYFCPIDLPASVTITDVISRPCFIPTASILIRSNVMHSVPRWEREVLFTDLNIRLWSAHHGPLAYLREPMAVRRLVTTGMTNTAHTSRLYDDTVYVLNAFNALTEQRYADLIIRRIREVEREHRHVLRTKRWGPLSMLLSPAKLIQKMRELAADARW